MFLTHSFALSFAMRAKEISVSPCKQTAGVVLVGKRTMARLVSELNISAFIISVPWRRKLTQSASSMLLVAIGQESESRLKVFHKYFGFMD